MARAELLDRLRELQPTTSRAGARIFFAPGRANLLGAHLDYNGGSVMPVALSRGTYLAVAPRTDRLLSLRSAQFPGEAVELPLDELRPRRTRAWTAYLEGALWACEQAWGRLPGLDLALVADLPMARGLSSSASVECVAVFACARLLGRETEPDEMIHLAHRAENLYVGVRCGILDQAAILLGRPGHLLLFDCLEMTREHLPLPAGLRLVVVDSGVQRELATSAFNQRVAECTRALAELQQVAPGLTCLRDVDRDLLERHGDRLAPILRRRVEHVVGEVERTERGAAALRAGRGEEFGRMMTAAHDSLRDLFEVSTPELDALVEAAVAVSGCLGARLTGAGFGGCIVGLVAAGAEDAFEAAVADAYRRRCGREAEFHWFDPGGGPAEIA
ncbi:MAG: galactokinase [Planctomycetota bacterium]|nr:MAG: galactokinase [Planctomycetota bacterium]